MEVDATSAEAAFVQLIRAHSWRPVTVASPLDRTTAVLSELVNDHQCHWQWATVGRLIYSVLRTGGSMFGDDFDLNGESRPLLADM